MSTTDQAKSGHWKTLPFAVGCFHFTLTKRPPYSITAAEYAERVEEALNSVSNISKVVVEEEDDSELARITIRDSSELPSGINRGEPFPLTSLKAEFELFIPRRIQDELIRFTGSQATGTERFRILLQYEYHSPIAFVFPLDENEGFYPSQCVPVIREFLRQAIDGASGIKFDALGPSPLHADFFLACEEVSDGRSLEVQFIDRHGYADVIISASPSMFASADEAFKQLRSAILFELDIYYAMVQSRARAIRAWGEIDRLLQELTAPDGSRWERFVAMRARARKLALLHRQLADFEATSLSAKHELGGSVRKHYRRSEIEFVRPIVEDELDGHEEFPVTQVGRIVNFLEDRRSKAFELVVVLIASLIGGVAGAALTGLG